MTQTSLTLPQRLKLLRAEKGWTLAEVAMRADLSYQSVSNLERGRNSPQIGTLGRLARAYEVPLEELVLWEEQRS